MDEHGWGMHTILATGDGAEKGEFGALRTVRLYPELHSPACTRKYCGPVRLTDCVIMTLLYYVIITSSRT